MWLDVSCTGPIDPGATFHGPLHGMSIHEADGAIAAVPLMVLSMTTRYPTVSISTDSKFSFELLAMLVGGLVDAESGSLPTYFSIAGWSAVSAVLP